MSAYAIMIRDKMIDADEFATYGKMAGAARGDHQIKPLAFYGPNETVEGLPLTASSCWNPGYGRRQGLVSQRPIPGRLVHRKLGAEYRVIFVEGL